MGDGSHPDVHWAPAGGDILRRGQWGVRAGAAVLAAVSAPQLGAEHVTSAPPMAPWTPGPAAVVTPALPAREGWSRGAYFPAAREGTAGRRARLIPPPPAPPQPQNPHPALTSGPSVAAAGLLVRHGRAAPARERSVRRGARARAGPCPCSRRALGPGLSRRVAGALL